MVSSSIKHVKLHGQVWKGVVDEAKGIMFLDVREEKEQSIELVRLDLLSMKSQSRKTDYSWWIQIIGVQNDEIYFVEYKDQNDPAKQHFFSFNWTSGYKGHLEQVPHFKESLIHPNIYEQGSDYHKTVAEFLALELPLSCEYLEWNDKIIISYYLRAGNEFDRHLLLLKKGAKEWKIRQDNRMKGFSLGAFFVFNNQLIFIKDRNEVCVYTG